MESLTNAIRAAEATGRPGEGHSGFIAAGLLSRAANELRAATRREEARADLAAAAQISVADYLGGIDWTGHEQTKAWYAMFKSRPSFRPLLSERMEVITPPKHYEQVDF